MKSVLALGSLSLILGTGVYTFQEALQHETLPGLKLSRYAAQANGVRPQFSLERMVEQAAHKHGVKATLVRSIIKAESAFQPDAMSNKGAVGLMQLMPGTAEEYGANDPQDPQQNISAGTKYISWLLKRYENQKQALPLAIAAYNAGPANVDKYKGIPPFRETMTYVKRVMTYHNELEGLPPVSEEELPFAKRLLRKGRSARVAKLATGRRARLS